MSKLLVIIPAFNEQESIVKTVNELNAKIKKSENRIDYLVINDGSVDKTRAVMVENKINHANHIINKGVGTAIKTGIMYALKNDYDYVTQFDADGQHSAEYLDIMINEMNKGYDIVIGSRFLNSKKPWSLRMLGSKVLSNLIYMKTKFKSKITDPTSGQRMLNRDIMEKYLLDASASEPAFAVKYINMGFKVKEIKVEMYDREAGESYFNIGNSIYFMLEQCLAIILGY